jgi:hypothetical protein
MKLDERINKLSDILTCVDIEEAKQFIGQKGYFSDCIRNFDDLSVKTADVLSDVYDYDMTPDMTFMAEDDTHWRYFIPECRLKPKEKKYVQFQTTHDLGDANLHLGNIINFVNTKFLDVVHRAVINEVTYDDNTKELIDITLGSTTYSFESLFNDYQFLDSNGKWVPFGKKVEE